MSSNPPETTALSPVSSLDTLCSVAGCLDEAEVNVDQVGIVHTNCQKCGELRPVKHVQFMRNIGLLVVRFPKTLSGSLCKPCISSVFWEYTLISLFLGWWGVVSFFVTLVAIPTNIVTFVQSRSLPG